ncbi:N-acetylmuramoyl-L-alanine amidase [Streptomyces sp. ISL-112]|uniref:peptidoglycan recognition protein family protein n=1 Tax=unclassified Streptomyces TaxID=2593676 RepID=UPI001BEBECB1|nr:MULTISPECIES: N-acetylmuramoyl-L-alanine amidase [unclassified Streptomyces]MBT2426133.1 N-acetylmuramoyl-L-alanine amidase [Streptomyces sp. ISL-112]MBT2461328.1 N-acetylmuramoyl-L-alanine amidase [Streptomyces sp. ISL-63]
MATPLTADRLLKALRDEGLTVIEHRSWRTNNRNHKGPWGPTHGVMIHHTVTSGTATSVNLCYNGHSTLPGPLCHGVIDKDGTVHLVGNGRTNHAGLGDSDALRAVVAEAEQLPPDNEANTDGNRHFYGFECVNLGNGQDPWPAVQLDAIERASAAICRAHGWGERSVIGHLEWQPGKIDPRGFTMDSMRTRIGKRLAPDADPAPAKPPTAKPSAPAKPAPPKAPVVDLSKLIAAARSNPKAKGTPVTYAGVRIVETALVDAGLLAKPYSDGHFGTATVTAYSRWQKSKAGGSYKGAAADGIPGKDSLTRLGKRAGFTVTP